MDSNRFANIIEKCIMEKRHLIDTSDIDILQTRIKSISDQINDARWIAENLYNYGIDISSFMMTDTNMGFIRMKPCDDFRAIFTIGFYASQNQLNSYEFQEKVLTKYEEIGKSDAIYKRIPGFVYTMYTYYDFLSRSVISKFKSPDHTENSSFKIDSETFKTICSDPPELEFTDRAPVEHVIKFLDDFPKFKKKIDDYLDQLERDDLCAEN